MACARLIFFAIIIVYPFIVFFGLNIFGTRILASALVLIALIRLILAKQLDIEATALIQTFVVVAGLLFICILAIASNSLVVLQYYPACLNSLMLALFAYSLIRPPTIIEQIARIYEPNLPSAAIPYTRKVTVVWCGFFALNGTAAFYTVWETSLDIWAIYNGLISYCLMGALLAGEIIVRRHIRHNATRANDRWDSNR